MSAPSLIEIDLTAVDRNVRVVRRVVGGNCGICGVVKADAYGLGAVRIARRLERAGATMLAVYNPDQAAELFAAAVGLPVLVLMPVRDIARSGELYRAMIAGRLHLTVHGAKHLEEVERLAERFGTRFPVHVSVDVGMSRGGCPPDEAALVMGRLGDLHRLVLAGVLTHFTSADTDLALTDAQLEEFDSMLATHRELVPRGCLVHAANTFATFRDRRFHKSMVRVGLAWAGYGAELMTGAVDESVRRLRPTMTWSSRIVHVTEVPGGAGVGYGHRWSATRASRIAVVPVGYADGYPVTLAGPSGHEPRARVAVLLNGPAGEIRRYVPVVGAVSMEQITIDLTAADVHLPAGVSPAQAGTAVELVSDDRDAPNDLTRMSAAAGMVPHALLCGLSPHTPRQYVEQTPAVHVASRRPASAREPLAV